MEEQSRYRLILILALSTWLAGGTCALAQVDTSGFDLKNHKSYLNCSVETQVDMLTDVEWHVFMCGGTIVGSPSIAVVNWKDNFMVRINVPTLAYLDGSIPVTIRIDKRSGISGMASWDSRSRWASLFDFDLAPSLLDELATGGRVAFRVGAKQAHISLSGSAAAIEDFRSRIRP